MTSLDSQVAWGSPVSAFCEWNYKCYHAQPAFMWGSDLQSLRFRGKCLNH